MSRYAAHLAATLHTAKAYMRLAYCIAFIQGLAARVEIVSCTAVGDADSHAFLFSPYEKHCRFHDMDIPDQTRSKGSGMSESGGASLSIMRTDSAHACTGVGSAGAWRQAGAGIGQVNWRL